mgnify:CR=1 FL=1
MLLLRVAMNVAHDINRAEQVRRDARALQDAGVPIYIQAYPDDMDKMSPDQRRDSFCGKLSVCNNLYQYGIPFSLTERHAQRRAEIEQQLVPHGRPDVRRRRRMQAGGVEQRAGRGVDVRELPLPAQRRQVDVALGGQVGGQAGPAARPRTARTETKTLGA